MALDPEELKKQRAARKAQQAQQKRKLLIRLGIAAAVLLLCGILIFVLLPKGKTPAPPVAESTAPAEESSTVGATETPEETKAPEEPFTVIHLAIGGDVNITDKVVRSGGSSYDFTETFMDVAHLLAEADLAAVNFEGNLTGAPYGSTGSAPQELAQALSDAGVDLVQLANSYSINQGLSGLISTINAVRAAGMEPMGVYEDQQAYKEGEGYTVRTVQGVKIAFVAFTKGVGSLGMPAGSEKCVNILYEDYFTNYQKIDKARIQSVLKAAESEKPDLTIALLHWGSEYNDTIYETQEDIVYIMQEAGVDVIIGTHPHRVQHVEYDDLTGRLVAYSLGDFFGDGKKDGTFYSVLLELEITKDYEAGITRVTDWTYIPVYTLSETECDGDRRVIRIDNAISAYETNFVDKVTASCYENLKFARDRISARIVPPPEDDKK